MFVAPLTGLELATEGCPAAATNVAAANSLSPPSDASVAARSLRDSSGSIRARGMFGGDFSPFAWRFGITTVSNTPALRFILGVRTTLVRSAHCDNLIKSCDAIAPFQRFP